MYVYYYTKYIGWPSKTNTGNIIVGVIGNSPVEEELKKIVHLKKSEKNSITVKRIDVSEVRSCQIVIVSKSQSSVIDKVNEVSGNLPILIVTEKSGLVKKGADICIYVDDEDNFKTKFEISKSNIQASDLKVANELLELGSVIN
jgi:hypothetical protein